MNAIHHRPTPTGTVIVAAVPFILGFQLLLQAIVLDIQNSPRAASEPGTGARPASLRAAAARASARD